jgi:hypothetical protein
VWRRGGWEEGGVGWGERGWVRMVGATWEMYVVCGDFGCQPLCSLLLIGLGMPTFLHRY